MAFTVVSTVVIGVAFWAKTGMASDTSIMPAMRRTLFRKRVFIDFNPCCEGGKLYRSRIKVQGTRSKEQGIQREYSGEVKHPRIA